MGFEHNGPQASEQTFGTDWFFWNDYLLTKRSLRIIKRISFFVLAHDYQL
jgi:hypothetical protein